MKKRHAIASLTVAAAGVAGIVGVQVANASGGSASGRERMVLIQTSADGPQTLYAVGPITGVATDTQVSDTRDVFQFPNGTITVDHVARRNHDRFDPKTCQAHLDEAGTYKFVGGTGAYQNVRGHGTYTVRGEAAGSCDENTPPTSFQLIIEADGTASL
jgi:hypothetical protein